MSSKHILIIADRGTVAQGTVNRGAPVIIKLC